MAAPIGRESECAGLTRFLDELDAGAGGVLLLEGDGGTGKTTLAEWTASEAAIRGFAVLAGRSWELSQSVPYEPIVAALGRFLRAESSEDRARLTNGLSSLATLIDGLGLPAPAADGGGSRARLHDAIATLIARVAADRPVVVLLDDLHWTDESSLEVLQFLCRDLPYVRVGIVAAVRPADADERPAVRGLLGPLRRASFGRSLTVRNLDRSETIQVIEQRLAGQPPARLIDLIWARSIGTPLVVHELIEDLLGRQVLELVDERWQLHDPDPPVPRAVADLIRDRIDRALPEERELLDVLAVADEPTRIEVMARVSSLDPDEISRRLSRLSAQRLVTHSVGEDGAVQWYPDHPIIAQVIAQELDEHSRRRLHRRLAAADPSAPTGRRARHIRLGGEPSDPAAAAIILAEAGREALDRGAPGPAATNFEAASELVERHGVVADDLPLSLAVGLGTAYERLSRHDEAVGHLERAFELADSQGDDNELLAVLAVLDRASFQSGGAPEAISTRIDRVEERLEAAADGDRLSQVLLQRVLMGSRAGRPGTLDLIERSVQRLDAMALGERGQVVCDLFRLWRAAVADPPPRTVDLIDQFLVLADEADDLDVQYRANLFALDHAGHLGLPEPLDAAIARVREIETGMGTQANWRIQFLRRLQYVGAGGEPETRPSLSGQGRVLRSHAIAALVDGWAVRFRSGPDAALAGFDAACARIDGSGDVYAETRRRIGRMIVAEKSTLEHEVAEHLCAHNRAHPGADQRTMIEESAVYDCALTVGFAVGGSESDAHELMRHLEAASGHCGLPAVAVSLGRSRLESDPATRAALLLDAAYWLDECRYPLAAAERRIEAAEVHRAAVDDTSLRSAVELAESCGARWLLERAAAVEGAISPNTGDRPDTVLTKREWDVAAEVAKGLTNREVASELFISIRTVTSHLDHIYTKLGIGSREQLSAYVAVESESSRSNT